MEFRLKSIRRGEKTRRKKTYNEAKKTPKQEVNCIVAGGGGSNLYQDLDGFGVLYNGGDC